jgi:hypothetical protein
MGTQSRTAVVAEAHLAVVVNPQEPYAPPLGLEKEHLVPTEGSTK